MRTDNYNGNNNRNNYNNTTGFNNRAGKVDLRILLPSKVKYFLKFIIQREKI